ncbi:MAG: alanine racemase [Humidesulfovibrio sp.]|uniref:alanine racemase n=1 Tax=Humidesulfovibrio sp. TaxID=2910988 RepID=UPI0027E8260C|nr:alanine racemase [Humidesulfovibrio sp.]MDQ7835192.1 alanine racemase [Humidesulfovibrio sp.]
MTIAFNKLEVRVRLAAIRANYRLLCSRGSRVIGVIKADAYGHGLTEVASALAQEGCDTFAVGTVEEGAALRQHLTAKGLKSRIMVLLGPLEPEDYPLLWEHSLLPLIGSFRQLEALARQAARVGKGLDMSLKFDTGMARLGFAVEDLPRLLDRLREAPLVRPVMVSSHLATADQPESVDYLMGQAERFTFILSTLTKAGLSVEANLANSAGILGHPTLHHQSQRAGIALYGANPFGGTSWDHLGRGLTPAMTVRTRIASVHSLPRGCCISYGCTYTAERDMRVAIVAAGYADAYSRSLTGKSAQMLIAGRRAPVIGRVCMQLTACDVTDIPDARPGEWATLLGGEGPLAISPEELASWWGTISYEVFCLLGLNRRVYI